MSVLINNLMTENEIDMDYIKKLRLEGKTEEADITLKVYQKLSGGLRANREDNKITKKIRKMTVSITLPIDDVMFLDDNGLKASELLQDKIKEIKNEFNTERT
jgi:hypothetical protein